MVMPAQPRQNKDMWLANPRFLDSLTSDTSWPNPIKYSAPRTRKVKIYSESEIEGSTGMTQVYRRFWNKKAEEICCSHSLTSFKAGEIQGAIKVAWTLEKSNHLKWEVDEINAEIGQPCSCTVLKKLQVLAKTIKKNTRRVDEPHESLTSKRKELTDACFKPFQVQNSSQWKKAHEKVDNLKKYLGVNLTELWKAQDSLRKSINTKHKIISDFSAW